jgi:hypothetical protein
VANRNNNAPDNRNNNVGFRLANTGKRSPEGRTSWGMVLRGFLSSSLSCPIRCMYTGLAKTFLTGPLGSLFQMNSGPVF